MNEVGNVNDSTTFIVGSGIVGLMCGYYLEKAGHKVSFIDAGPDPLDETYNKDMSGATFSGGNARHISATETTPWAWASMDGVLDVPTIKGGWLAKPPEEITSEERAWIEDFYDLTRKPLIHKKYWENVTNTNNTGKQFWRDLVIENPSLFVNSPIQEPTTIYFLDQEEFESEVAAEAECNPTYQTLTSEEIIRRSPIMEYACEKNYVVGALIVDCFAINAIELSRTLIRHLQSKGVRFFWNEQAVLIAKNRDNQVAHITTQKRNLHAKHFIISAGAYGGKLLEGTRSYRKLMGVVGVWITIPNPGISHPFKIDAPRPTGYINGTLEGEHILISGGYGFIGTTRVDVNKPGIEALFSHMEGIIRNIFPKCYEQAVKNNTLDRRYCVRPAPANGLGVFETIPTVDGGKLIVVGGNSAGGFTQAPVMARAVLDSINHRHNEIHYIFDPDRFTREN